MRCNNRFDLTIKKQLRVAKLVMWDLYCDVVDKC
jgi:hypothetical protein